MVLLGAPRVKTVPLVCGRWYRVMADASMWSVVDAQPRGDRLVRDSPHAGTMVKWLQRRGPGMRELTLRASERLCIAQIHTWCRHCVACPPDDLPLKHEVLPCRCEASTPTW
jgi:hypothetical protein